jgi:hypothetical protein
VVRNGDKLAKCFGLLSNQAKLYDCFSFEAPTTHRPCCGVETVVFSPRVIGVRVNQELNIENNDATYHNTHPTPKINPEFNRSQPPYTHANGN